MSEDRRDQLDRWSQNHDRAVAYLLCTREGRSLIFDKFNGVPDDAKLTYRATTEFQLGAGSADIVLCLYWKQDTREEARTAIVEVKTGKVIAGDVIRQLKRYESHLTKIDDSLRSDGWHIHYQKTLILAHVQQLTEPARLLFVDSGIYTIHLSTIDGFLAFHPPDALQETK